MNYDDPEKPRAQYSLLYQIKRFDELLLYYY